jgi:hypothetical protein
MAGIQGTTADAFNKEVALQQSSGGKGGGTAVDAMGRPTLTAMNTPIIYGKSYLNNYTKDYVAPLAKDTVTDGGGNGGDGNSSTSGGVTGVTDGNTANSITGLAAPANLSIPDVSMTGIGNTGATAEGLAANAAALSVDDASISEGVSAPSEGGSSDGTAGGSVGVGDAPGWANGTTSVPGYYNGTMGVDDDPWVWTRAQPVAAPLSAEIKPSNEQALGRMPDRTEQQLSSMLVGKGVDAATQGINTAYKAYTAAPLAAAEGAAAATTGATAGATSAAMAGGEAALGAMGPVGAIIGGALLVKKAKDILRKNYGTTIR